MERPPETPLFLVSGSHSEGGPPFHSFSRLHFILYLASISFSLLSSVSRILLSTRFSPRFVPPLFISLSLLFVLIQNPSCLFTFFSFPSSSSLAPFAPRRKNLVTLPVRLTGTGRPGPNGRRAGWTVVIIGGGFATTRRRRTRVINLGDSSPLSGFLPSRN